MKKKKRTSIKIFKLIIPALIAFLLVVAAADAIVVYRITHPARIGLDSTPQDYQDIWAGQPSWSEESWKNQDGTESKGWLLRRPAGSPAVVLSHGYGSNRSELLNLGVALWKEGYFVLLYDLRGHGLSPVKWTSLGEYESDDLVAGIRHLKGLKDSSGKPLIDADRIGLYGVSTGGYASLIAATRERSVKAVAVDSVYPTADRFARMEMNRLLGMSNRLINNILYLGMLCYFPGKFGSTSANQAVREYQNVKLLFIAGADSGDLRLATGEVFTQSISNKEMLQVQHTRLSRLYLKDGTLYDQQVVNFFRRPDVLPVEKQKTAGRRQ